MPLPVNWQAWAWPFGVSFALLVVLVWIVPAVSRAVRRLTGSLSEDWGQIKREVFQRERTLNEIKGELSQQNVHAAIEIASTDMFVEKAQRHLLVRANSMTLMSAVSAGALFATIIASLAALFGVFPLSAFQRDTTTVEATVLSALHNIAVLGVFLALVYLFASLLRAFLHEATVLNNRIHSLRLGRLFIYLQFASVSSDEERATIRASLKADDIDRIFGWNYESSTAFKDIRPEFMTKTVMGQIIDTIGKYAKK